MISVILVSHGGLAQALLRAAESIVGARPGVLALGIGAAEAPQSLAERLISALAHLPPGNVLVLVDVRGGSPHSIVVEALERNPSSRGCAVVSGVSLPMVIEALLWQDTTPSVAELARRVVAAGLEHIEACEL